MRKFVIIIGIVSLIILTGCIQGQDNIIKECSKLEGKCEAEKCMNNKLLGYTGNDMARANYFQCLYINEKVKNNCN